MSSPISYFEQKRQEFINSPFESKQDAEEFQVPLPQWGEICDKTRASRRALYKTSSAMALDQVIFSSLDKTRITRSDGEKTSFVLWQGNIETLEVSAIVNAANESLLGGGGVDQAIHSVAGPLLVKECAYLNGCEVSEAKITKGYKLPSNYVLHTVGPLLENNETPDEKMLAQCYRSCLELCEKHSLTSVAFPCISCGFYGFPNDLAAKVALKTVKEFIEKEAKTITTVLFTVYNDKQVTAYKEAFSQLKGR